jgi:hypothetical protein
MGFNRAADGCPAGERISGTTCGIATAGTSIGALHFGHGTRRPAKFSGADNFCPQLTHVTVMFIFHLGEADK